jgi:hypothetical protein
MMSAAVPLVITLAVTNGIALAQEADDPMAQLRACSLMDRAERQDCLDRLSRTMVPDRPPPDGGNWIVSETTSPVDYSPIINATTTSQGDSSGLVMKLSIRCRGGRTALLLEGPGITGGGNDYAISLRTSDGPPLQFATIASAAGPAVAIGGDVVRLLQSLPDKGELAVHLSSRTGNDRDAVFPLAGLEKVRAKMTPACKWPKP